MPIDMGEAAMAVPVLEDIIPSMVKKTAGELADLVVEGVEFPSKVALMGSSKELFVGGAGVRGVEIGGRFRAVTAIAVYLEATAVSVLAGKWRGKSPEELAASVHFFQDIVTGHFEKLTKVTLILPLSGQQYSEKVVSNCVASWTAAGVYTKEEDTATKQFLEAFKPRSFQPTSSIFFSHSPGGPLSDGTVPETWTAVIENQKLSNAVLESVIGENGVSPAAKWSLAQRISELLRREEEEEEEEVAFGFEKRIVA